MDGRDQSQRSGVANQAYRFATSTGSRGPEWSSAGMTSTRSTRLLTHRKSAEVAALPRLSVCQIAVVSSRSNMRSQIQLIEQLIGAGEENFSVQASPRSPPTQNRRKVETVTCSICAK
jgi:hypothetical protein